MADFDSIGSNMGSAGSEPAIFSLTSLLSLAFVLLLCTAAYTLNVICLPRNVTTKIKALFLWHAFDAFVHLTLFYIYHDHTNDC